ncbi:hypothetical protein BJA5080_05486 [Bradyrhizobium diazoefficiens SEMIA 5080]|uniref:Uncharacterized protein n=1 Tax=Bradyrhizobium diazoefficiens SEMIA 5080 TaxID=754504 RepID=A0A837C3A2_9BRAD|nr:hypothetical protein BJA5080_05486 [Bradyrhizobium diazoefficiens SEMIA 5080]
MTVTRSQDRRGCSRHQRQCNGLPRCRSATAHSQAPETLPGRSAFPEVAISRYRRSVFLPRGSTAHIGKSTRCGRMQSRLRRNANAGRNPTRRDSPSESALGNS